LVEGLSTELEVEGRAGESNILTQSTQHVRRTAIAKKKPLHAEQKELTERINTGSGDESLNMRAFLTFETTAASLPVLNNMGKECRKEIQVSRTYEQSTM
jgi:hypothetical protein